MISEKQFNDWVQALERNEYKKGQGCLAKKGRFCCLGVLADQMGILQGLTSKHEVRYVLQEGFSSSTELPSWIIPPYEADALVGTNDSNETWKPVIAELYRLKDKIVDPTLEDSGAT